VFAGDLFVALSETLNAEPEAVLRLSRLTDEAIDLRSDAVRPDDPAFCGTFHFQRRGQAQAVWLRRRDGDFIQERTSAAEHEGLRDMNVGPHEALAQAVVTLPLARAFLAVSVGFLKRTEPASLWSLAELRAAGRLQGRGALRVTSVRRLNRFVKLCLELDGRNWGDMTLAASPKGGAA
jgi:hypothetical protein